MKKLGFVLLSSALLLTSLCC